MNLSILKSDNGLLFQNIKFDECPFIDRLKTMSERDLRKWTNFFQEAGVPRGPAAEYATLFCDHRIKDELLGDLTKDILNDIGITVMGDIICILKHAKALFAKLEREKSSNQLANVFDKPEESSDKEDVKVSSSQQPKKKKSLASKGLSKQELPVTEKKQVDDVSTTSEKTMAVDNSDRAVIDKDKDKVVKSKKRPVKTVLTLSERFAGEKVIPPKVQRISADITKTINTDKTNKSQRTTTSILPLTEGTKHVTPSKRQSAFERLGKEEPYTQKDADILASKIRITKPKKSAIKAPSPNTSTNVRESSVFKRLGETEQNPVSTVRTTTTTVRTVTGLEPRLHGGGKKTSTHVALKPLKPTRAVKPVKPVPVSPVKTSSKILLSTSSKSSPELPKEKKSVFSRLGSQRF